MKIAIVGSRDFLDADGSVMCYLSKFHPEARKNIVIISGGARGVDAAAEKWATRYGMKTEIYPADWEKHGKAAGFKRNEQMVREADLVVAFWDGESHGTRHSIDLALKHRKTLEVYFR